MLPQHRQEFGAPLHRCFPGLERTLEHLGEKLVLLVVRGIRIETLLLHVGELTGDAVGHLTDDGDHRFLRRIAHRVVGSVGRARQCGGHQHWIDQLARAARKLLGRAANDLRQDHAAVATSAEERGARNCVHDHFPPDLIDHLPVETIELDHHGLERLDHVVARVAIGDREHVQVVHLLPPRLELGIGGGDDLAEANYRRISHRWPISLP